MSFTFNPFTANFDFHDKFAEKILIDNIPTATYDNVQDYIDLYGSSGLHNGGEITDAGGATIDVAAGTGAIRSSDDHDADLLFFDFSASVGIAIPTDTTRYIGVEYNAGSPQIVVKTTDTWNTHTEFSLGNIVNEADTLHILFNPEFIANFPQHTMHRLYETEPFQRADRIGGLILSESGDTNRNITLSAGEIYDRVTEFDISAIDTSGADTFDSYSSNGLESSADSVWDNDNYDLAGTLTSLNNNKFAVLWFYLELGCPCLVCVYGTAQYNTAGAAEEEGSPQILPDRLSVQGKLIGRLIFQKGVVIATEVQSVFTTTFSAAGVTLHNSLGTIQLAASSITYGHIDDQSQTIAGAKTFGDSVITGKINPTATSDVELFGDTDVGDAENGKRFLIHRKAAEGDALLELKVDKGGDGIIKTTNLWKIESSTSQVWIQENSSGSIELFRFVTEPTKGNAKLNLWGWITAASTRKFVSWQVDDADDYLHLTREDANILGFKVEMPLEIMDKTRLTAIAGIAIKLTNKTGGDSVAGQLVEVYSATAVDDAVKTSDANSVDTIGIILDAGISDGNKVWVVVSGIADVLIDAGGSARGDRIITSATAGSGYVSNTPSTDIHFQEIGHCMETRTGAGLARVVLHFL